MAETLDESSRKILDLCGVYVVTYHGCDRAKIGHTTNIVARLTSLETGAPYPLELLAFIPGPVEIEKDAHRRFSKHHARREWFDKSQEFLDGIVSLTREYKGVTIL